MALRGASNLPRVLATSLTCCASLQRDFLVVDLRRMLVVTRRYIKLLGVHTVYLVDVGQTDNSTVSVCKRQDTCSSLSIPHEQCPANLPVS